MRKFQLHVLWRIDESSYANRLILDSKEYDHYVICLKNTVSNPQFTEVLKGLKIIWLLEFIFWKLCNRNDNGLFTGSSLFGEMPWKIIQSFIRKIDDCNIILHWIGYNMLDLQKIKLNQPAKIILHDFHLISGGCHIVGDCNTFSGCDLCPKSNRKTGARKQKIQALYSQGKIKFYAPSEYVQERIKPIHSEIVYAPAIIKNFSHRYNPIKNVYKLAVIGAAKEIPTKGYQKIKNILAKVISSNQSEILLFTVGSRLNLPNEINSVRLNSESIFKLLAECDLLLQPSEYETFSQITLESTFQNTPVIAWDNSGPASILTNEKNGFLIPAFDEEKFYQKIQENLSFKRKNLRSIRIHNKELELKILLRNKTVLKS